MQQFSRRSFLQFLAAILLVLALGMPAQNVQAAPVTVLSNLSPGTTLQGSYGGSMAVGFRTHPTDPYMLTSATFNLLISSGPISFNVGLYTDAGGHPGGLLASFSPVDLPQNLNFDAEYTVTLPAPYPLELDTTYWIAFPSPYNLKWGFTDVPPTGIFTSTEFLLSSPSTPGVWQSTYNQFKWALHAEPILPAVSLSTTRLDFVNQWVGSTSAAQTVTITNTGYADLVLGNLGISGEFNLDSNPCNGQTIAPGGTCTFGVTFSPTSAGGKTGSVSIPSNAASSPDTVSLGGNILPYITSPNNVGFIAGNLSSFTITTSGDPIPTITWSGSLPTGIGFTDNLDGTATLSGIPAISSVGVYHLTLTASNGTGPDYVQNFTLTIDGPPSVSYINSFNDTGDGQIVENEHTSAAITQLLVVFNKQMNAADAETLSNYDLLLNGSTAISIDTATYDAGSRTTTLSINSGVALPDGGYSLTVQGNIRDTLGVPVGTDFIRAFFVDTIPPAVTINQAAGQSDPTSASPINFTVTFSEAVSGFEAASDVLLTGTAGATTAVITGGPVVYNVAVSGMTGNGTVIASLPAGAAVDAAANASSASSSSDSTVMFVQTYQTLKFRSNGANDGTLRESSETSGFANFTESSSALINVGDDGSRRQLVGILDFDTASIPDNAVITGARLQVKGMIFSAAIYAELGNMIADITKPFFGTSAGLETMDFRFRARATNAGTFTHAASAYSWIAMRVNPGSLFAINKTGRTQFRLRFTLDDSNDAIKHELRFLSGDHYNAADRPMLVITYYVP